MKTPTQPVSDPIILIRDLASGKVARAVLDCGQPHAFVPRDLIGNQEALLLLAGIEQILAKHLGVPLTSPDGDGKLQAELGLTPLRVPSLLELLTQASSKLHPEDISAFHGIRILRNQVLHGATPLFLPVNVDLIRSAYAWLLSQTGHLPEGPLAASIAQAQAALRDFDGSQIGAACALLVDLLGIIDLERAIRDHLSSQPSLQSKLSEAESAFELLDLLKSKHVTKKLRHELRLVFTLRNHIAHGLLLEVREDHRALVRRVTNEFHGALAATQLTMSGGKQVLGGGLINGICL